MTEHDQDQDGPPCGKCGHSPAEHMGWARGHLWIRSMHYPAATPGTCPTCGGTPDVHTTPSGKCAPAEVQPPQGAGATARTFEVVMSSSGHIDDPDIPCHGPQCDGACSISEKDCPGYRPGFPLDHRPVTAEDTPALPIPLGATSDTPLPLPYCHRVDRPAPHRLDGTFQMSYGTHSEPPRPLRTMMDAAAYVAAETRIGHAYWGPLTVWVWPHRGEHEHSRMAPPADAYRLDLGDQTDTIPQATKDAVQQLHDPDPDAGDPQSWDVRADGGDV